MEEMEFFLTLLHAVPGIRDRTIYKILKFLYFEGISPSRFLEFPFRVYREKFGLLEVSARALSEDLEKLIDMAHKYLEDIRKLGFRVISVFDESYPSKLKKFMEYPPPILYVRGNIENVENKTFAILNSRDSNEDCMKFSEEISSKLSGVVVGGLYGKNYRYMERIKGARAAISDRGVFQISNRRLGMGFETIISFSGVDDMGTPGSMLTRDRVIMALSDKIVGVCIRNGGNMEKLLFEAVEIGKNVYRFVDNKLIRIDGSKPLKI